MSIPKLSTLQVELLKAFALNPSEQDLIFIRKVLVAYFSTKSESESESPNDLEDFFTKASIKIIATTEDEHLPLAEEPTVVYHKTITSNQSKNALAKAVAKEDPLILE